MTTVDGISSEKRWFPITESCLEGKAWHDTSRLAQRLPDRAESLVNTEIWKRAFSTAGMAIRFITNATAIDARWEVEKNDPPPPIETCMRIRGLDLYARHAGHQWRWLGAGIPTPERVIEATLARDLDADEREYLLYLPLQSGLLSLVIGVPAEASFAFAPPRAVSPLVFYGTSIVHGGAASRPGLAHVAILGRWLDMPVINLGFPGFGRMDLPLAHLLGELDAAAFVVDCLPNMGYELVAERAELFLKTLRRKKPDTPILVVGEAAHPVGLFCAKRTEGVDHKRETQRRIVQSLVDEGMSGLYYVDGADMFGDDNEATFDNVHPNDLGFMRMAETLAPAVRAMLGRS